MLYIPRVDAWWSMTSDTFRATFTYCILSLPSFCPLLILCTAETLPGKGKNERNESRNYMQKSTSVCVCGVRKRVSASRGHTVCIVLTDELPDELYQLFSHPPPPTLSLSSLTQRQNFFHHVMLIKPLQSPPNIPLPDQGV